MDHDDTPIGRLLSRREALALFGAGSAALLIGCSTSTADGQVAATTARASTPPVLATTCLVKPEATEGPFFFTGDLHRQDLRSNTADGDSSPGIPLELTIGVSRIKEAACVPLVNAIVDIWHCDARGAYSGYESEGTEGKDFLRGFQRTNEAGEAAFLTVYPGWYQGRAVHIHLKVRTSEEAEAYEFTSQLYFPDTLSDKLFSEAPYTRSGGRRILNANDGIYVNDGGDQLLLTPEASGEGYAARFDFGLDLSDLAKGESDASWRRRNRG